MATFLNDSDMDRIIELLILKAKREVTLICPNISMPEHLLTLLCERAEQGIKVSLVYRHQKFVSRLYSLTRLPNLSVFVSHNLNARCYCNESNVVMASRPLSSEVDSLDMGVLLTKSGDSAAFVSARSKIDDIKQAAEMLIHNTPETLAEPPSVSQLSSVFYASAEEPVESPSAIRYFAMANDPAINDAAAAAVPSVPSHQSAVIESQSPSENVNLLTTTELADHLKVTENALVSQLVADGFLIKQQQNYYMAACAKRLGAISRVVDNALVFMWPTDLWRKTA